MNNKFVQVLKTNTQKKTKNTLTSTATQILKRRILLKRYKCV